MAMPPGGVPSYPSITEPSFTIVEAPTSLTVDVRAAIDDDIYAISDVYLLDNKESIIGQLQYSSYWGKYVYQAPIDPDYQPTEFEKIRACNSAGFSSTEAIPASEYHYPNKYVWSNIGFFWCSQNCFRTYDFDGPQYYYDQNGQPFFNEFSDLVTYGGAVHNVTYCVLNPTQAFYVYPNFWSEPGPSREYLMELYEGGLITQTSCVENPTDIGFLALITTEGRLAYLEFENSYEWGNAVVYSLYNGPWAK
jgi:hypothetical protein